jgi:hypothetical protein
MKARAFCLGVRGFVSLPVRETFALNAFKSNCRTFPICHLAGVPFEIPFREIARQMGFADRMMRAEHGALHKAETTLRGINVNEAAEPDIFIGAVVHRAVVCEFLADFFVGRQFVCHQMRLAANCRDDLFAKRFGFDVGDMKRTTFAIALDQRHNGVFFRLFLRICAIFGFAAEHRFIAFDHAVGATNRTYALRRHRFANAKAHKPRSPVRAKAEHTPELMRAHAFLAGANKMRRKKPLVHRNVRVLVNCANRGGELLHAFTAAIKAVAGSFANDRIGRIDYAAVRANTTVRPADSFEMLPGIGFVIEDWIGKIDRHFRAPLLSQVSHIPVCLSSA